MLIGLLIPDALSAVLKNERTANNNKNERNRPILNFNQPKKKNRMGITKYKTQI